MRLLSQHQIDQFREDGFLVVENLLDLETVGVLRQRFECLFRGEFETGISPDEVNWQVGQSDPSLTRQICNGWKADSMIARTVLRRDLGREIAHLANWPGTRLFQDNLLWKPPGARPIGHHQDNAYVGWLKPQEIVSCWMALDDTQAQSGTLELIRGSHRWKHSQPDSTFHGPQRYREAMERAATIEGIAPDIVSIEIPCGGASFHHGWVWHGSGNNRTTSPRRALVLHGISSASEFVPERLNEGNGPIYGRYKRPEDEQLDDNHFPILWREDGYRTRNPCPSREPHNQLAR